jgi:SEL1 protein
LDGELTISVPKKQWSLKEWINNFLREEQQSYSYDDDDNVLAPVDNMPGGEDEIYDDLIDEGILESFIIITLAAALVWLIYYRQQRQLAHRRQEEVARARQAGEPGPLPPQQQQDGGFFPAPGNPAFPDWVAGGIGH